MLEVWRQVAGRGLDRGDGQRDDATMLPLGRWPPLSLASLLTALLLSCAHSSGGDASERGLSELFQRTCDGPAASDCTRLGARREKGDGVSKDEAHAAALYELGCNGGDLAGCTALGVLLRKAASSGPNNSSKARVCRRVPSVPGASSRKPASWGARAAAKSHSRGAQGRSTCCSSPCMKPCPLGPPARAQTLCRLTAGGLDRPTAP